MTLPALLLEIVMVVMTVPLFLLSAFVLLQVLMAHRSDTVSSAPVVKERQECSARPSLAVLIPAHNESAVLATSLQSVLPQLETGDRLLLVADNCSDDTAGIGRALGAEVVERSSTECRGKGYALDFGIRHLISSCSTGDSPQVLVLLDADSTLSPGGLARLSGACVAVGKPFQALYLMQHAAKSSPAQKIAEFAWRLKNWVRPLGSMRLGLGCHAMGAGMALPWNILHSLEFATSNIVEDMKLGVDLVLAGHPMQFAPDVCVYSQFPDSDKAESTQRRRWEHGHLQTILHECPRLFRHAIGHRSSAALGLALDLAVPPLSLFVTLHIGMLALVAVYCLMVGFSWVVVALLTSLAMLACATTLAWWSWGRDVLAYRDLVQIPRYIVVKLPLYLAFWKKRQTEWVRTDRE